MTIERSTTSPFAGTFTICTSSTRPGSPNIGDSIFETDTGNTLRWYGTTPAWQPPWNQPWGVIGYAQNSASQTGITTVTDITGVTITFTPVLNRIYRTTLHIPELQQLTNAGTVTASIRDGTPTVLRNILTASVAASGVFGTTVILRESGLAASSIVRKGSVASSATSLSLLSASSTAFAHITVEDIGSSGAPS